MANILYGECVGPDESAEVRISGLADRGCDLETDGSARIDGDMALWIGAIGPLAATAVRRAAGHFHVHFKEPLDSRIVEHFALA